MDFRFFSRSQAVKNSPGIASQPPTALHRPQNEVDNNADFEKALV